MKFTYESPNERIERLSQWHKWFAWCPVEIAPNESRWLEFVMRKGTLNNPYWLMYGFPEFVWEYRAIDKP